MEQKNNELLSILRHSASHIMAAAVVEIFPETKVAIGPSIENGFYYDFYRKVPFTKLDLVKIEEKMIDIIKKNYSFEQFFIEKKEAINNFYSKGEKYKIEIASKIDSDKVSIYKVGNFYDLCKGPHVKSTGELCFFKLLYIASAYWKGDSSNEQLQRIYGTAFFSKNDLDLYLINIEEIKKRDHRKIGKDLDMFSIDETIGSGLILWHNNGSIIRDIIETFWKKLHIRNGYDLVNTPHIASEKLFEISGHIKTYNDNMYSSIEIEKKPYRIKPMNCPMHLMIYKKKLHSYKDLPVKYAELGTVYRFEKSGVLYGLMRVRGFTQDDGHIIVTDSQLEKEILIVFNLAIKCLKTFGFDKYKICLATRPKEKYIGEEKDWIIAERSLKNTLEKTGYDYEIDDGGGAFYGPKIDIKVKDVVGRLWQCTTIQFDFNLPQRLGITYIDSSGKKVQPYIIHRALFGSLERFIGLILEHYNGSLPLWISPVQVAILNISEKQSDFCLMLQKKFNDNDIRNTFDNSNEKIGFKIRLNSMKKIPYIIVVGDKEKNTNSISVRVRDENKIFNMSIDRFISTLKEKNIVQF
jgi:threonyl-tRNA synthetase